MRKIKKLLLVIVVLLLSVMSINVNAMSDATTATLTDYTAEKWTEAVYTVTLKPNVTPSPFDQESEEAV